MERGRDFAVSPSESRTVGGRRQERDESTYRRNPLASRPAVVRGSCRLPRFAATPGPVKTVIKNSPGHQHKPTPDQLLGDLDELSGNFAHNGRGASFLWPIEVRAAPFVL
jgi:hypothetical protein